MKTSFFITIAILSFVLKSNAQFDVERIPVMDLLNIKGEKVNTSTFTNNGNPIVLFFWASWNKVCYEKLDDISKVYENWKKETDVKIVVISFRDKYIQQDKYFENFFKDRNWQFDIYFDVDESFKNAMNVNICPEVYVIDSTMNIVYQIFGNNDDLLEELYNVVLKIHKGEKIESY